jgi:hypothetical protein
MRGLVVDRCASACVQVRGLLVWASAFDCLSACTCAGVKARECECPPEWMRVHAVPRMSMSLELARCEWRVRVHALVALRCAGTPSPTPPPTHTHTHYTESPSPARPLPPLCSESSSALVSSHSVHHDTALRTPQFYLFWGAVCGNAVAGVAIISCAKTMMTEIFGAALPHLVTGGFAAGFVMALSAGKRLHHGPLMSLWG